jgi:hypothetical protein
MKDFSDDIIKINNFFQPNLTISTQGKIYLNKILNKLLVFILKHISLENIGGYMRTFLADDLYNQAMRNCNSVITIPVYLSFDKISSFCKDYFPDIQDKHILFIRCVCDYLMSEILELSGIITMDYQKIQIKPAFINKALNKDISLDSLIKKIGIDTSKSKSRKRSKKPSRKRSRSRKQSRSHKNLRKRSRKQSRSRKRVRKI